jgi:hypothetical protein
MSGRLRYGPPDSHSHLIGIATAECLLERGSTGVSEVSLADLVSPHADVRKRITLGAADSESGVCGLHHD